MLVCITNEAMTRLACIFSLLYKIISIIIVSKRENIFRAVYMMLRSLHEDEFTTLDRMMCAVQV